MKHTPGPWSVDNIALTGQHLVMRVCPGDKTRGAFNDEVCRLAAPYDAIENARLIAAAPELLEALKVCRDFFHGMFNDESAEDFYENIEAYKAVVSAIAQAEGRDE